MNHESEGDYYHIGKARQWLHRLIDQAKSKKEMSSIGAGR